MSKPKIDWKKVWKEFDKWFWNNLKWVSTYPHISIESQRKKIHKLIENQLNQKAGQPKK